MITKRTYAIAFIEGDSTNSHPAISLSEILREEPTNDYEYYYAIQENLDAVLDLKVGDRLQMNFNRDNEDSAGFIKRIK